MRRYISELFKKIMLRPLLIPAVVIFLILTIFLNVKSVKEETTDEIIDIQITIEQVDFKLNGKKSYIGRIGINKILVVTDEPLYPGYKLYCKGYFKSFNEPTNPGEFDYSKYMSNKGIKSSFIVNSITEIKSFYIGKILTEVRYFIRNKVFSILSVRLDETGLSYLSALCLGDSSLVSSEVTRDFRVLNCSHVLAVSGSHFAGFILLLPFVGEKFKINKRIYKLVNLIVIILLGFMTGWSESVTRASIMCICGLYMRDSVSGMSFSALVMMIGNPYSVLSNGFKMSYCACIGILLLNQKTKDFLQNYLKNKHITELLSVTLSSQVGVLIFSSINSTRLGIAQIVSQIVSGIIIEIICVFFILGILLSFIEISFLPASILAELLIIIIKKLSRFAFISIDISLAYVCVPIIVICIVIMTFTRYQNRDFAVSLISFVLISGVIVNSILGCFRKDQTKIIFIDVGQGDCCLIITDRYNCLIDSGVGDNGISTIPYVLDYYSISTVDFAIMTHWDEDHGGGMMELLKSQRVDKVYTSFTDENDNRNNLLQSHFEDSDLDDVMKHFYKLDAGQSIILSDNDCINIIWPLCSSNGENEDSLVIDYKSFNTSVLFTGDIDETCEKEIIDKHLVNDIDVLKVAHHGSRFSSSKYFLDAVRPENAIISVGEYNYYGHPSRETLDRLGEVEAKQFLTSKNGAIIVNISRNGYFIDTFKENKDGF